MGRYYSTESGREGKFGFGSQPSTDPGDFFDMEEQEPSEITYSIEKDNYEMVKEKVDGLYDKLGVPAEERIYYLKKDIENNLGSLLEKYAYRVVNDAEVKRYNKIDGFEHETYYNEEKHKTFIDAFQGAGLCCSRIRLGLVILSDLQDSGYCELKAEM